MLSADSDFEFGTRLASALNPDAYQFSHALAVDDGEGILLQNSFRKISRQNLVHVVAREAERGLRQVIRTKAEEFGFLSNFVSNQRRAGQFDHGSDQVVYGLPFFFEDLISNPANDCRLVRHFLQSGSQRNHDFGVSLHPIFFDGNRSLENGAGLHLGDLWIGNSQAAAAMAEHGIELVQLLHPAQDNLQLSQLW